MVATEPSTAMVEPQSVVTARVEGGHRHILTGGNDADHADRTGLTDHAPGQTDRGREGAATRLVGSMKEVVMVGPTDAVAPNSRATVTLAAARVAMRAE
jgi:hypothetical protein